jgi:hypothetical protein
VSSLFLVPHHSDRVLQGAGEACQPRPIETQVRYGNMTLFDRASSAREADSCRQCDSDNACCNRDGGGIFKIQDWRPAVQNIRHVGASIFGQGGSSGVDREGFGRNPPAGHTGREYLTAAVIIGASAIVVLALVLL